MTISVSVNDQIVAAPAASCDTELAKGPWIFDLVPGYGPGFIGERRHSRPGDPTGPAAG